MKKPKLHGCLVFGVLLACLAPSAHAQTRAPTAFPSPFDARGTPEDEKACRGDATKLCRHLLSQNDDFLVLQCFQANRSKLSKSCEAVLRKYGQ